MDAVIIEDEEINAQNLISYLDEIGGISVLCVLDSIAESVDWFQSNSFPDIVFMDIHLADGSAFEIFEHVTIDCPIIFTTAYNDYALKAFDVSSIDYLLKPLDIDRVRKSLSKYQKLTSHKDEPTNIKELLNAFKQKKEFKQTLLIPQKGDKLIPLSVDDIAFINIEDKITKIFTINGQHFVWDKTLDEIFVSLEPDKFFRANRQYIISHQSIKDINQWFNNRLLINLKIPTPSKIIISRAKTSEFVDWFTKN